MDIKVVSLQKNRVLSVSNYSKEEKEKFLTEYLQSALGLKIIVKDYFLTEEIYDKVDYLCIDEAYRLVIVEKRYGKDSRTIKSGLMFIDFIKENISKIKMLIGDKIGVDVIKDICFDCRLVILTESFTHYDYSSIKSLPYTIEAINYAFIDKNLIFVKEYQNKKNEFIYYNGMRSSLYLELENFLLSLGEDVSIFGYRNVITVRKIKAFMFIIVDANSLILYINNKEYIIDNYDKLNKILDNVEKAYDEN